MDGGREMLCSDFIGRSRVDGPKAGVAGLAFHRRLGVPGYVVAFTEAGMRRNGTRR